MVSKLYQRDALAPGISDLMYLSRADGTSDGATSLADILPIITSGFAAVYAPLVHTHVAADVTDFSTAADARIAAKVGVTVQAYDADLNTYASITPSADVQSFLGAANYAAMKTQLALTIGTNVQAWDADLDALAALSGTNTIYYRSASNTWTAVTIGGNMTFSGGTLNATAGASGTVTTTGSPTSGNLSAFSGSTSITNTDLTGDVTTSGGVATTIGALKVATGMIQASAVTLAKIANAAASSKLVGSGASGSGSAYAEITLGTGLSMSGTTLNATAAGGMTLLASSTPSGTGVVTFSSISGSYKELRLTIFGRGTQSAGNTNVNVTFNNDTGANYDQEATQAGGGSVAAQTAAAGTSMSIGTIAAATATADVASSVIIMIPGYANTTFQKSGHIDVDVKTGTTTAGFFSRAGSFWYRSTTAISRIDLTLASGNYVAGTEIYLYGIS